MVLTSSTTNAKVVGGKTWFQYHALLLHHSSSREVRKDKHEWRKFIGPNYIVEGKTTSTSEIRVLTSHQI